MDEFGNIPITIWNEQIESTEEGFYEIHNICLRQFKRIKYLSSAIDTVFNKLTENLPDISEQQIKHAEDKLKTNEVTCDNIQSVEIMLFYNLHELLQEGPISAKFTNAQMYELPVTISHQEFYENYDSMYFGQRR